MGRTEERGNNKNSPHLPNPLIHPMDEREKSRSLMRPWAFAQTSIRIRLSTLNHPLLRSLVRIPNTSQGWTERLPLVPTPTDGYRRSAVKGKFLSIP